VIFLLFIFSFVSITFLCLSFFFYRMKIHIVAVGKLKEKACRLLSDEYLKRISRFADIDVIEVRAEQLQGVTSEKEKEQTKATEWQRLQKHARGFVILLDERGKSMDTVTFSKMFRQQTECTFIIGGALGISKEAQADMRLSLSSMTLPHELARVLVLEQIYRAETILANHPYHNP
jgi:23S rRNA (pseudouridine1915-N3)-methyltransferase